MNFTVLPNPVASARGSDTPSKRLGYIKIVWAPQRNPQEVASSILTLTQLPFFSWTLTGIARGWRGLVPRRWRSKDFLQQRLQRVCPYLITLQAQVQLVDRDSVE